MPSAALAAFYDQRTDFHKLHNSEIKDLCNILTGYPVTSPKDLPAYWERTERLIRDLPGTLRTSRISITGFSKNEDKNGVVRYKRLCNNHAGLNYHVIYHFWKTIRHEFNTACGAFLYPIIVHCGLTKHQEDAIRHMEPVLEMWREDFEIADHTPPGRRPLRQHQLIEGKSTSIWYYQQKKCPACILARLGSSTDALFALMAAMVGRMSPRHVGKKTDIKSKRIRWIRYWLRQLTGNDRAGDDAYDFGEELRRIRHNWVDRQRKNHLDGFYGEGRMHEPPSRSRSRSRSQARTNRSSTIGVDISSPYYPGHSSAGSSSESSYDSRIIPRSSSVISQFTNYRVDLSNPYSPDHQPARKPSHSRSHSRKPKASHRLISPGIEIRQVNDYRLTDYLHSPVPSFVSQRGSLRNTSDSEFSWESDVSSMRPQSPERPFSEITRVSAIPAPLRTTGGHTPADSGSSMSSMPNRRSMYGGFNHDSYDSYQSYDNEYDVSPPCSPIAEEFELGDLDGARLSSLFPLENERISRTQSARSPEPRKHRADKYVGSPLAHTQTVREPGKRKPVPAPRTESQYSTSTTAQDSAKRKPVHGSKHGRDRGSDGRTSGSGSSGRKGGRDTVGTESTRWSELYE